MVEIVLYGKYFPRSMEIYDKHFLSTRVIKTVLSFEIIINAMDMVASKSSAVAIWKMSPGIVCLFNYNWTVYGGLKIYNDTIFFTLVSPGSRCTLYVSNSTSSTMSKLDQKWTVETEFGSKTNSKYTASTVENSQARSEHTSSTFKTCSSYILTFSTKTGYISTALDIYFDLFDYQITRINWKK